MPKSLVPMSDSEKNLRLKQTIVDARLKLKQETGFSFVSADQYYELIVSNSHLQRFEIHEAALMGLSDPANNLRYVVEVEHLDTDRTW